MFQSIVSLGPWFWLILAALLSVAEALIPGVFLAWFGAAAFVTGLISFAVDLTLAQQSLVFAFTSGLSVIAARFFTSSSQPAEDLPNLNRREQQLVGRIFKLDEDMVGGRGKVRVGDSSWQVEGPDLSAGAMVEVTGLRGNTLLVTPVNDARTAADEGAEPA